MRKTITVWLATDEDGDQNIFLSKPEKDSSTLFHGWTDIDGYILNIGKNIFNHEFNNEPIKIEMVLRYDR